MRIDTIASRLERNTYTNLSRDAAAGLVTLVQDEHPIELNQSYDADSDKYTVTVVKEIRSRAAAKTAA